VRNLLFRWVQADSRFLTGALRRFGMTWLFLWKPSWGNEPPGEPALGGQPGGGCFYMS